MGQYYFPFLHTHALLWLIALILFGLAILFVKSGKEKIGKILQMTLRLFFVFVIATGVALIIINDFHWSVLVKGALAIWLIAIMELIVTKSAKQQLRGSSSLVFWLQFLVSLILVLYFGYFVT